MLEKTLNEKEPFERSRVECRRAGGPCYVLSLASYPMLEQTGRFLGAVMVCRDETYLNDLEVQLNEIRHFHKIVGKSGKMQKIYEYIEALARTQTTVLIRGESGTGKELVAEALHMKSPRHLKPFIRVNCSALAETLLESELFGHVKGSFTGAYQDYMGRFQRAQGGTIFLDEIGDISPKVQVGLLRVLQEKEIERIGDHRPIKLDVRVVAATNKDLQERVRSGQFREDLYFRLKVVEVVLPPLRERKSDIALLVRHFIDKFNRQFEKGIEYVSDNVLRGFSEYDWPGNVRELGHAIEHAFVLCDNSIITLEYLPPELASFIKDRYSMAGRDVREGTRLIQEALRKTGGNKARAARMLGIDRKTLYRKLQGCRSE
jgi:transcriptional regulator with PAS, ATPase and Fis domain